MDEIKGHPDVTVIGWNMSAHMAKCKSEAENLDMIYTLENNLYNGVQYPRMILLDVKLSN